MISVLRLVIAALLNRGRWLLITILADYVLCALVFNLFEHRGPVKSLWWAIVTGFTVGYGDVYPATTAGRGVGAFLIVTSWFLTILASAFVTAVLIKNRDEWTHEEQEAVKQSLLRIEIALGTQPRGTIDLPYKEVPIKLTK